MNEVEKKLPNVGSMQDVQILQKKLASIIYDVVEKNKCPKENSRVNALLTRVANATDKLKESEAKFGGAAQQAPATQQPAQKQTQQPTQAKQPTQAAQPVAAQDPKLPYPQRKLLKDAQYYLTAVTKQVRSHAGFKAALEKNGIGGKVTPAMVRQAKADIEGLIQKLDNCDNRVAQLPQNHSKVARIKLISGKCRVFFGQCLSVYNGALNGLAGKLDMKNYPDFTADMQRLKAIKKAYGNVSFVYHADKARSLCSTLAGDKQFVADCNKKYATLVANARENRSGQEVVRQVKWASGSIAKFDKCLEEFKASAVRDAQAALDKAISMAKKGQQMRKPGFFTGGVPQCMNQAKGLIDTLAVVMAGDPKVEQLKSDLAAKQKQVAEMAATLKDEIIASVKTPEDVYAGRDKAKLKAMVLKEWKRLYPDDEVLGVRFHMQDWKRNAGHKWNSSAKSWEAYDKSVLAVKVVVKTSPKIATLYVAYFNKDNLANTINCGAKTKKGAYVIEQMLLSNYKP